MRIIYYFILLFSLLVSSCTGRNTSSSTFGQGRENVVSNAERFVLIRGRDATELRIINPWQGATGVVQTTWLVKAGSKLPSGVDSSDVIFVPVKRIICMSTTHLAMISVLGEEKSIAGVSGVNYIYSPDLIRMAEQGNIQDVGYESNLNKELILKIRPDLIMIYGVGSESSGYLGKVKELGVKVLINADYLETDPLRRAEWIKLFGALYCREELADSIYKSEVNEYHRIKEMVTKSSVSRPKVLLGLPFKDAWYISPGNSFVSKLISDAGGDYLWSDVRSDMSLPYGIENVYLKGLKADFWLNTGTASSKQDISGIDPRLGDFPCFKIGNLYNNNARMSMGGGNDYWESGILHPHLILEDIASILHPELFPGHKLMFFRKLN